MLAKSQFKLPFPFPPPLRPPFHSLPSLQGIYPGLNLHTLKVLERHSPGKFSEMGAATVDGCLDCTETGSYSVEHLRAGERRLILFIRRRKSSQVKSSLRVMPQGHTCAGIFLGFHLACTRRVLDRRVLEQTPSQERCARSIPPPCPIHSV